MGCIAATCTAKRGGFLGFPQPTTRELNTGAGIGVLLTLPIAAFIGGKSGWPVSYTYRIDTTKSHR
jgi:hypothetical protein